MSSEVPRSWGDLQAHLKRHLDGAFELDGERILLNAMVVAPPPRHVCSEIAKHRDGMKHDPAGYILHRSGGTGPTRAVREATEAADWAAWYLGLKDYLEKNALGGADVIAQTTSTTMGLALLANGIHARRGQEVLLSIHEFFSSRDAWRLRCDRTALRYREIRLYDDTTVPDLEDRICQEIEAQIREHTRVLALTWVDSGTGVKLPVARIAKHVQALNLRRPASHTILLVVDGVHGFGVENISFEQLGCHFLVAGCHKWLFGPRGTGIICALPDAWAHVTPTVPTFLGDRHPGFFHTPGGVATYEHTWAVSKAFKFQLDIGKACVEQHTVTLASRLKAGLAKIKDVRVITPASTELSSGIVCCAVHDAEAVLNALADMGISAMISSDADGRKYLRFSPSILNNEAQIDTTIDAVSRILG